MVLNKTAELVGETDALLVTLAKIEETGSLFERLKQDQGKITLTWEEVKTMVADRVGGGLKSLMREVFGSDDLADVTLTCRGGAAFHAHKMVLAAASTYFRNFFMEVRGKM